MARDVVDSVVERGECDFVNDDAGALPSYVIAELLGIPLEDGYRLYELVEIVNTGLVGDPRSAEAGHPVVHLRNGTRGAQTRRSRR